jgi:hypothetical protein
MSTRKFQKGDFVQYTSDALARMPAEEQRRFKGRTGQVAGYRMAANEPYVDFPRFGRFKEVRFYELDSRLLELATPEPAAPSKLSKTRPAQV